MSARLLLLATLLLAGCDSVASYQIEACAKACAAGHRVMDRCTDKECICKDALPAEGAAK